MSEKRDRRTNVRVRPSIDLPAEVLPQPPDDGMALQPIDISLGGIGVWVQRGATKLPGTRLAIRLCLAGKEIRVEATVRHANVRSNQMGLQLMDVSPEDQAIINHYVAELVERGGMA